MPETDIGASLSLDISSYTRDMNKATKMAYDFDSALDTVIGGIKDTDKALNSLDTDIDLSISADTSALDKAKGDLAALDTKITPLVDITVDDGAISTALRLAEDLNNSYTPKLTLDDSAIRNAQKLLDSLDAAEASVKINTDDSEVTTTKRKVEALDGETATVKVDAEDSELAGVRDKLEELRNLAIIEIAMNFADTLPKPEDVPILGAIVDSANAAAKLEASLGSGFRPAQAQLSDDVYTGGLADSRGEAAAKVATSYQMIGNEAMNATATNEDMFSTIERGTYTAINLGAEYQETLLAAKNLVQNDLAPSYEEAFNLMNAAQQRGLNMSGDLLDTIIEYAPQFKEMGLSAEEAFNVMEVASKNGVMNLDKVADGIKEFQVRLQQAISDPESAPAQIFDKLGLTDELAAYKAGELSGAELARGINEAAETGLANGTLNKQDLFDLLGAPAEDLTIPVALDIIGASGEGAFANTEGVADQVSNLLGTSLDASITTAQRLIETKVADSINTAFDIQGKIDTFNTGISKWADLVGQGESITGAAEKAFNIQGLEDAFNRFESTVGNLIIELATVSANILEGIGQKGAADTIRGGVADMTEQQLTFDLKLARDGEGITSAVDTAIRRGVEASEINEALATAGSEFIQAGDFAGARAYIEDIQSLASVTMPPVLAEFMSGRGVDPTNFKAVRAEIDEIMASGKIGDQASLTGIFNSEGMDLSQFATQLDYAGAAQEVSTGLTSELDARLFDDLNTMFSQGNFLQGFVTSLGAGEIDTAKIFGGEILTQIQNLPNQLMTGLADTAGKIPAIEGITAGLDGLSTKVGDTLPTVGTTIDTSLGTPIANATTGVNKLAETILAQVPVIGEQATTMQEDLVATSTSVDGLNTSVDSLNDANLSPLQGQFAGLKAGIVDQVNYAIEQVNKLAGALAGLGGTSVGVPTITVPGITGGAHLYGGVIPEGTIGKVHGNEMIAAAPMGAEIAVLNSRTSSVIESALAGLIGGGGGGSQNTVNNYNNNFVYNVQSNAQGFMSEGAARAARGF